MKNCFVFWMLSFNLIGKCINSWPITLYYLLCTVGHLRLESWNTTAFLCGVTMWSVPLITYIFIFLVLSNLHLKYHNWNYQERTQHTIIYVFHKFISLNQYVLCVLCVAINIYCSYMYYYQYVFKKGAYTAHNNLFFWQISFSESICIVRAILCSYWGCEAFLYVNTIMTYQSQYYSKLTSTKSRHCAIICETKCLFFLTIDSSLQINNVKDWEQNTALSLFFSSWNNS